MAARGLQIGKRVAPPRFIIFMLLTLIGSELSAPRLGWAEGVMAGFDLAAFVFFGSVSVLFDDEVEEMRRLARRNDANRAGLLVITGIVMGAILAAVWSALAQHGQPKGWEIALIIGTLCVAWIFSNLIYALHYAHLFYTDIGGGDARGIEFPKTPEPDYWDFLYFATCLGMTFQVSDMSITSSRMRRVVMFHCLAAFIFNLGIIAFTINVLGGSS